MDLVNEFTINGHKALVYDNAMPPELVEKWLSIKDDLEFRSVKMPTKMGYKDANNYTDQSKTQFGVHPISLKKKFFKHYSFLAPGLTKFDKRASIDHYARSFVNRYVTGNQIQPHMDLNHIDDDCYYCVCLMYVQDNVTDPEDSGFYMGYGDDITYVPNVFNRVIMFDARIVHWPDVPSNTFERLTLYMGYTTQDNEYSLQRDVHALAKDNIPGTTYRMTDVLDRHQT
jgi:hypothetical protein